mmetsp:Transcript_2907/g.8888  ORF Transcript_2907/g.8888 Transcript_2907/m.8888 type:complete len:271 (+) Transcript_2907:183-995(+)
MSGTGTVQTAADSVETPIKKNSWHNDHSKKYRANVGEKFQQLSKIIAEVKGDVNCNVKFKSEILETAVNTVRDLTEDVHMLEVEVAMSSRKFMTEWIEKAVLGADRPSKAVRPLVEIMCRKKNWKYVEVWEALDGDSELVEIGMSNSFVRVTNNQAKDLHSFSRRSSSVLFNPGVGLVGRVWASMQGELVSDVCDPSIFMRATLAMCKGVASTVAVPIVVLGQTHAVILFYDMDLRYDTDSLKLAESIAGSIGTVYGAKMYSRGNNSVSI